MVKKCDFDLIEGLMDEDLLLLIFPLIFFEEVAGDFEVLLKIVFFNLFIHSLYKFRLDRLVGLTTFLEGKILFKLLVLFRNGVEIVLELSVR